MNVKFDETYLEELAALFIPNDKKEQRLSKIEKYIDIQKTERVNKELVARIEQILNAGIENLWSSAIEYVPREVDDYSLYPENNLNLEIESPAQSWNAISVGAFTQRILPDRNTVAGNDELSPISRTTNAWMVEKPKKETEIQREAQVLFNRIY